MFNQYVFCERAKKNVSKEPPSDAGSMNFPQKKFDEKDEIEYVFCTRHFCAKKMLKKIFGSGARVKLFRQFLLNPKEEFFIRELTRILDEQINSLRRELENLEKIGMLKSSERNRKKYYRLNPHCPILSELTSIIRKNEKSYVTLLQKMSKLGGIDILILGGQFIGKEASVDMFLVGDIKKEEMALFVEEEFVDQQIKFSIMPREDFLYRMTLKDKFVKTIFEERENIILKNKLKKDTEPLFEL